MEVDCQKCSQSENCDLIDHQKLQCNRQKRWFQHRNCLQLEVTVLPASPLKIYGYESLEQQSSCLGNGSWDFLGTNPKYIYISTYRLPHTTIIFLYQLNSENLAPDSVHKSGLYGLCYGSYHSPLPLFEPTSAAESTTGTWASALVLDRGRALKCTGIIYKTYWAATENRILKDSICKDPNVLGRTSSLHLKSSS